jgi:hypothetical protein
LKGTGNWHCGYWQSALRVLVIGIYILVIGIYILVIGIKGTGNRYIYW